MSKETTKMIISPTGRIQIPKHIRDRLKLKDYDVFNVRLEGKKVMMELDTTKCVICGKSDACVKVKDCFICNSCVNDIAQELDK